MDLRHKHWALAVVGILIALFILIVGWFMIKAHRTVAPTPPTATSTIPVVTAPAGPAHITENAQYYDIDLTYPSATPLTSVSVEANAQAVSAMKAGMQQIADEFKKNGDFSHLTPEDIKMIGLGDRKEAVGSEYELYKGPHTVSYVFDIYEDTLGAHPNTYYRTFTFDARTGAAITLGDLFANSSMYLQTLSTLARTNLPEIIARKEAAYEGDVDTEMIDYGTTPSAENFENFYIKDSNLVIVFAPYQVGPYALGTVELPIPLSKLSTDLKATFK